MIKRFLAPIFAALFCIVSCNVSDGFYSFKAEPGTDGEIAEFCTKNFGVTFPLMAKSDVNGENAQPVFKWLYAQKPFAGFGEGATAELMNSMLAAADPDYASNPDIKWNFTKFLIDRKGNVTARFEPTVAPADIAGAIEDLL